MNTRTSQSRATRRGVPPRAAVSRAGQLALTALLAACAALAGCAAMYGPMASGADSAAAPSETAPPAPTAPFTARAAAGVAPGGPAFENAWAMIEAGRYAEAEQALAVWIADYGQADNPRTPNVLHWLGYCREKLGRPAAACDVYRQILTDHPRSAAARRARRRLEALGEP